MYTRNLRKPILQSKNEDNFRNIRKEDHSFRQVKGPYLLQELVADKVDKVDIDRWMLEILDHMHKSLAHIESLRRKQCFQQDNFRLGKLNANLFIAK